jgi:Cys/Met metabolism PLP-dependent enzyme
MALVSISLSCFIISHASIDPATRAARGLPEDLIRLCVGIEDAEDLLDDLENSLLEAGAIALSPTGDKRYVRVQQEQLKDKQEDSISIAFGKLANIAPVRPKERREWFVSAPGKVIMFGEHAVVHGVVSLDRFILNLP